jgi:hypothetical protein
MLALVLAPAPTVSDISPLPATVLPAAPLTEPAREWFEPIWQVEAGVGSEVYSNGLRVENRYAVGNEGRRYPVYDRNSLEITGWSSAPAGIVFHSTESQQAPFDESYNGRLRRVGQWLLEYLREQRSYHFLIDRFGRVHRVVAEADSANHAGHSVWADGEHVYVNLNQSFFGVAFETQTGGRTAPVRLEEAQIHAGRILTGMLRAKYHIPARNCVTHAQVSVAPSIHIVGNHIDWIAGFPFGRLGLPDNYGEPLAALAVFGFRCETGYLRAAEPGLWKGVILGANAFRVRAASHREPVSSHRTRMRAAYRRILEALDEATAASGENQP